MTPDEVLREILARVGTRKGASVYVDRCEMDTWPPVAVAALKAQKLLVRARPADSVVCPGCEEECVMPVHSSPGTTPDGTLFVVCDKRSDINRVRIGLDQVTLWRCDPELVGNFIAASLAVHRSGAVAGDARLLSIGIARGEKCRQMLCLRLDADLALICGDTSLPTADVIEYGEAGYFVNADVVGRLVDSAGVGTPRHTPSVVRREVAKLATQDLYEAWRREYRRLKKEHPNMTAVRCSQRIAKQPIGAGRSPETIRRQMKR